VPTVFPADRDSAYHLSDTMDYGPWAVSQADEVIRTRKNSSPPPSGRPTQAATSTSPPSARSCGARGSDLQSDLDRNTSRDIPTFTLTLGESLSVGTGKVGRVLVLPETVSQDGGLAP